MYCVVKKLLADTMTLMVFFGCTFIAFGPSLAMFVFTVMAYPLRIILLVVGAFFWLISLLFSALLWLTVVPLKEQLAFALVFSVLFQEIFRIALFKLLHKSESGLDEALTDDEKRSIANHKLSYVSGFGFGLMCGLFSVVNILSSSIGPANVGINGSPSNFYIVSSFFANCIVLLHTFWNVIVFHLLKHSKYVKVGSVLCMHMLVSCLSLMNKQSNLNFISLIVAYVVLFVSSWWAFVIAGGSLRNAKAVIMCSS